AGREGADADTVSARACARLGMLWASIGVPSHSLSVLGSPATPSLPRRSTLKLRVEVRGHDHQVHEPLGIAPGSVVVLVGAREPLGIAAEVAGDAVDEGDQFANGEWLLRCLRLEAEPCGVLVHDPVRDTIAPAAGRSFHGRGRSVPGALAARSLPAR